VAQEIQIGDTSTIRLVTIRGRVQGVGYRAWVEHHAMARQLEGWVRNRREGSVEALFAGPAEVVADMTARCRRGPSAAQVEAVQEAPASSDALDLRRGGERFSVLPTI
jgi:acylphosphatase